MTPLLRPLTVTLLVVGACWYFDAGYPQVGAVLAGQALAVVAS